MPLILRHVFDATLAMLSVVPRCKAPPQARTESKPRNRLNG